MPSPLLVSPISYISPPRCSPRTAATVREPEPTGPPKPRLLDRVLWALRARHYSRRTEAADVAWIRRYILHHDKRHPADMGAPEVTKFLTSLTTDGDVAASTQNQALSALLFLDRDMFAVDLPWLDGIVRASAGRSTPLRYTPAASTGITRQVWKEGHDA